MDRSNSRLEALAERGSGAVVFIGPTDKRTELSGKLSAVVEQERNGHRVVWLRLDVGCSRNRARVARSGAWFEVGSARITCARRPAMARLLAALANAHETSPHARIPAEALARAVWPGELDAAVACRRLRTLVCRLRAFGLAGQLETENGYRLGPATEIIDDDHQGHERVA